MPKTIRFLFALFAMFGGILGAAILGKRRPPITPASYVPPPLAAPETYDPPAPPILLDVTSGGRRVKAIAQVAKTPEIVTQRRDAFSDSVGGTPAEFAAFLDAERGKWGAVIKQANVKIE